MAPVSTDCLAPPRESMFSAIAPPRATRVHGSSSRHPFFFARVMRTTVALARFLLGNAAKIGRRAGGILVICRSLAEVARPRTTVLARYLQSNCMCSPVTAIAMIAASGAQGRALVGRTRTNDAPRPPPRDHVDHEIWLARARLELRRKDRRIRGEAHVTRGYHDRPESRAEFIYRRPKSPERARLFHDARREVSSSRFHGRSTMRQERPLSRGPCSREVRRIATTHSPATAKRW